MLPENTNDRMLDHLATPVKIVPEEDLQAVRVAHLANPAQTVGRVRLINLRAKCVRQASIKVETLVTIVNLGRWHRWAAPVVHLV